VIKRRIDALEDYIESRWRKLGQYRLIVETNIKSVQ